MFEHNCRANCSKSFTSHGELLVRAMEDIPKGGHLSICYTDPLWATGSRQMHLSQTKFFNCSCQRCKDPTELGHFLSAIKCTTGYVVVVVKRLTSSE
jgi:SET domain-containing protein